jgi:adenylate cyclase
MTELEPALTRADLQVVRRRRTDSVDAWSHFRQAYGAIAIHGWNEESLAEALQHSRRAIAIDPDFALARALLALLNAFGTLLSLVDDRATAEHDAREQAELAVAIDPNASDVLGFSGCALSDVGEHQRGCELLQRAVELDPSNAQAHVALGAALTQVGRVDDGIKSMQYGMRSSPKDFRLTFWSMILAHALGRADRLEEALSVAMAASRRDGRLYGARVVAAWALQRLDRPNEAREALLDARRIRPALNLDEIRRFFGKRTAADISSIWN